MLENTQIFVGQAILSYDSTSTMYKPPFTITNNILMRKDNQVKTIYSSLAIEGNSLSEELITQILEGKRVIAPKNDIIEVQNALVVYKNLHKFNPVTQNSILEAHKILMKSLIVENGVWRSGGVGIISKDGVSHVAPRAKMVPGLMNQLFNFLKNEADLPWLIKACVFHYELEFIHSFSDGNGRIGRLCQQLLLMKEYSIYEF